MKPEDILNDAYPKSKKFQPGKIVAEATEGLGVVNRVIRTFFQIGVRVNPTYFGDSATVAHNGTTGWPRPTYAEAVYRLEQSGSEVVVVPFDQRAIEAGKPAVYRWGQIFRSAGNTGDPTSGSIDFFYSKRPADATSLTDDIDSLWPEAYAELATLEVAAYMAAKDKLTEELAYFVTERDRWLRLFIAHLEHETLNERRSWGHIQEFNTGSLVPVASLLTGGSSVELAKG